MYRVLIRVAVLFGLAISGTTLETKLSFTTPSEAYASVHPATETDALGSLSRRAELQKFGESWCPVFEVEKQMEDELYYLALLCRDARDWRKAEAALERYLAEGQHPNGPQARLLLAFSQRWLSQPDQAWQTLHIALQTDPIGQKQYFMLESLIDDEAQNDEAKALEWTKEWYSLLVNRTSDVTTPGASYRWIVLTGAKLVHLYYIHGDDDQAHKVLEQLNGFKKAHARDIQGFAGEDLRWANSEMQPAPSISINKLLSRTQISEVIQQGRVEVVSFFFLGCRPCIHELPKLVDLQKQFAKQNVLVADVTTYEANSSAKLPTHSAIDAALDKTRRKNARHLAMVVTSQETLRNYGVIAFPVVVVIDKSGRLRYAGRDIDFDQHTPIGWLIAKLAKE